MTNPVVVSVIQNRRGTQAQFDALYPPGYIGIGGFNSIPGFTPVNFPNTIPAGQVALCTDTRRIFIGNINGEYVEMAMVALPPPVTEILLTPLTLQLAPVGTFTLIPELTYQATPFTKILYDLTDSVLPDWNVVGTNFSRNGQLEITAVANFVPAAPIPPYPPITPVTLSDTGTDINLVSPNNIQFIAQYDFPATNIEIFYMHDFAGPLTFSTGSIKWLPF